MVPQAPGAPHPLEDAQPEQSGAAKDGELAIVLCADISFVRSPLPQLEHAGELSFPMVSTSLT
jgi:hypothetical protein